MTNLHYKPITGRSDEIIQAILATEEVLGCKEDFFNIHLACEEIVVNIVDYAYPNNADGYMDVKIDNSNNCLTIVFKDGGIPFNPLDKDEPDTSSPLEQRSIGGLGIFLIQKIMDVVSYAYKNNENVLTLKKIINNEK